jgi:hypothetical protein
MPIKVAREIIKQTSKKDRSRFMKRKGRKNPSEGEDGAASLSKSFHGREPREVDELLLTEPYLSSLTKLGDLQELEIIELGEDNPKFCIPLTFNTDGDLDKDDSEDVEGDDEVCSLCSSPDGKQLFIIGGGQEIDPEEIEWLDEDELSHELVTLGEIFSVTYFTDKHHLEGPKYQEEGCEYIHKFGEDGGVRPLLVYDSRNKRLQISGGSYKIESEGIKN